MLLPKQNFEHWIVFRTVTQQHLESYIHDIYKTIGEDFAGYFIIAGTQRLPTDHNDFITVYIPFIDGFTTIRASDIVFTIHNIKPNVYAT